MRDFALFINGIYDSVLEEIRQIQSVLPEHILSLQPHKGERIVELNNSPPSVEDPMRLFMSTTSDLNSVHYRAEIVGWDDKTVLTGEKRQAIERILKALQPGEGGLYDAAKNPDRPSRNLIHIWRLTKLDPPFPASHLLNIRGETRLGGRERAGGWVYVHREPVPVEPEEQATG
jgi:hypothetical protein